MNKQCGELNPFTFYIFFFSSIAYPKFLFDRLDFTYEFVNDAVMLRYDETLSGVEIFNAVD